MSTKKIFAGFPDDHIEKYKKEVEKKWGNTEAYTQSKERTKHWKKEDYEKIKAHTADLTQRLASAMDFGSDSPEFQKLIAEHHKGIEVFYDCPMEMYRSLGQMYIDDPRFTALYDNVKKGLAVCVRDGIAYFCDQRKSG